MDENLDTSWCPGCDREVRPQRYLVVVDGDSKAKKALPTPASVAAMAQVAQKQLQRRPLRGGALGGALAHGTGRVKPGGGIRRDSDQPAPQKRVSGDPIAILPAPPPPSPSSAPKPPFAPKVRSVISQEPTPLYCSEECRLRDSPRQAAPLASLKSAPSPAAVTTSIVQALAAPHVPPHRRSSDSSEETTMSSIFDHPPRPLHSPLDPEDVPRIRSLGSIYGSDPVKAALCRSRDPKDRKSQSSEQVPPGWRHNETDWRKLVYGNLGAPPPPHPPMPESAKPPRAAPAPPASVAHTKLNLANLSPFDRLYEVPKLCPEELAKRELLAQFQFARVPNACGRVCRPVSRPLSRASSITSSVPPLTASRSPSGSRSSYFDDDDDISEPESPLNWRRARASARSSVTVLASPQGSPPRIDPLAKLMAERNRERRKLEREEERIRQTEQQLAEARTLRDAGGEPLSWEDRVKLQGPIIGRRAAGLSQTPTARTWSFESLPRHIPLYPASDFGGSLRTEKRRQRVRDETTGEWKEIVVEVPIERKKLFLFATCAEPPPLRRHSTLSSVAATSV